VQVDDVSRVAPLSSEFKIHVDEEVDDIAQPHGNIPSGAAFAGLPNIRRVFRDT